MQGTQVQSLVWELRPNTPHSQKKKKQISIETVLALHCFDTWILVITVQLVVLGKTLESSLKSKEIKAVYPKGNQPEYSLEGLMLKPQYLGHLMWRVYSLEKILMLGMTEGRRRRGWQRTRRSGRWWRTGKPGVLQFNATKPTTVIKVYSLWFWVAASNINSPASSSVHRSLHM